MLTINEDNKKHLPSETVAKPCEYWPEIKN
jgi:hypothetical protein